eukprot:TRINITY_DN7509_c0_g1_i1.p1 TRINITY_DN7509_c0_g1~~TRINITY_DN7509_c0_g1_i1.p1  ORF type:complete len:260 (+),score=24.75 TRINITY_DN7509_c0_g1_i1:80-859(+)
MGRQSEAQFNVALWIIIVSAVVAYAEYQLFVVISAYRHPVWTESVTTVPALIVPRIVLFPVVPFTSLPTMNPDFLPTIRVSQCICPDPLNPLCSQCQSSLISWRYQGCWQVFPTNNGSYCLYGNVTYLDINYDGNATASEANYITFGFSATSPGAYGMLAFPATSDEGGNVLSLAEVGLSQLVFQSGYYSQVRISTTIREYLLSYFIYRRSTVYSFTSNFQGSFPIPQAPPDPFYSLGISFGSDDVTNLQQTIEVHVGR